MLRRIDWYIPTGVSINRKRVLELLDLKYGSGRLHKHEQLKMCMTIGGRQIVVIEQETHRSKLRHFCQTGAVHKIRVLL